jgi:hypothetical protein
VGLWSLMRLAELVEFLGHVHGIGKCGGCADVKEGGNIPFEGGVVDAEQLGFHGALVAGDVGDDVQEDAVECRDIAAGLAEGVESVKGAESLGMVEKAIAESCADLGVGVVQVTRVEVRAVPGESLTCECG